MHCEALTVPEESDDVLEGQECWTLAMEVRGNLEHVANNLKLTTPVKVEQRAYAY